MHHLRLTAERFCKRLAWETRPQGEIYVAWGVNPRWRAAPGPGVDTPGWANSALRAGQGETAAGLARIQSGRAKESKMKTVISRSVLLGLLALMLAGAVIAQTLSQKPAQAPRAGGDSNPKNNPPDAGPGPARRTHHPAFRSAGGHGGLSRPHDPGAE